jgi:hypothetical protein
LATGVVAAVSGGLLGAACVVVVAVVPAGGAALLQARQPMAMSERGRERNGAREKIMTGLQNG